MSDCERMGKGWGATSHSGRRISCPCGGEGMGGHFLVLRTFYWVWWEVASTKGEEAKSVEPELITSNLIIAIACKRAPGVELK